MQDRSHDRAGLSITPSYAGDPRPLELAGAQGDASIVRLPPADERTRTVADQSLSDADQTRSDSDQSSSELDQASADQDQQASDLDQAAADRAHDAMGR